MTSITPSVETTIFPRVNQLKNFNSRAIRRDLNGRIYGNWTPPIDEPTNYPAEEGSVALNQISFPLDLGMVSSEITRIIDLRNPEIIWGTPGGVLINTIDLND